MKWLIIAAVVLLCTSCTSSVPYVETSPASKPDSLTVIATWRPPTGGGPVDTYELQLSTGQKFLTPHIKLRVRIPSDRRVRGRVRGINSAGTGPFSNWGPWFPALADTLHRQRTPNDPQR